MHEHSFDIKEWVFSFPENTLAVTSKYVMSGERPILSIIHDSEDYWQFLCDTTNDPEDHMLICMGCLFEKFPFISEFLHLPKGCEVFRESENQTWKKAEFKYTEKARHNKMVKLVPLRSTRTPTMHSTESEVTLRLMTEADLDMLHDWLNRPHIVEWWGGEEARPSLEDVRLQYLPRALAEEGVTPYIAMRGVEPIGYAQSYVAMGSGDGWWEEETDPGVRGIDQSLASPTDLNKGLGTALVRALVRQLFTDPAVTKIQTDPAPENHRAIRCYEKAGFVQQGRVTTPDGPAIYMAQTRQAYEAARGAT